MTDPTKGINDSMKGMELMDNNNQNTASSTDAVAPPPPTTTATNTTATTTTAPSTAKRDLLRMNERMIQMEWDNAKVFESDAITKSSNQENDIDTQQRPNNNKFMVTFPYPYMNGVLHIGHAFSFSKAIFRAQYERHLQHNVLLPFGFHCTGMPIQAVRIYI